MRKLLGLGVWKDFYDMAAKIWLDRFYLYVDVYNIYGSRFSRKEGRLFAVFIFVRIFRQVVHFFGVFLHEAP